MVVTVHLALWPTSPKHPASSPCAARRSLSVHLSFTSHQDGGYLGAVRFRHSGTPLDLPAPDAPGRWHPTCCIQFGHAPSHDGGTRMNDVRDTGSQVRHKLQIRFDAHVARSYRNHGETRAGGSGVKLVA